MVARSTFLKPFEEAFHHYSFLVSYANKVLPKLLYQSWACSCWLKASTIVTGLVTSKVLLYDLKTKPLDNLVLFTFYQSASNQRFAIDVTSAQLCFAIF